MCGIVGFVSPNPTYEDLHLLKQVFIESKVRGLHAFGCATLWRDSWHYFKTLDMKEILDVIDTGGFQAFMGHTRYSTSGDYRELSNNQPVVRLDRILVFNGVIDMRTKDEMERAHGVELVTENDGELFLCFDDPIDFLKWTESGSFAGLYNAGKEVYVLRNFRRPAWRAWTATATFVASTEDILVRAGLLNGREVEPFLPLKLEVGL